MDNPQRLLESPGQWDRKALATLLHSPDSPEKATRAHAAALARERTLAEFGKGVYIRGLVEVSNFCQNDCLYCGIRRSNQSVSRYRLTDEAILDCCQDGYRLGFRTFVLQGGEDPVLTDDRLVPLVASIRQAFPDCAITLSLGERSRDSYHRLRQAGADRYLLRHETADPDHYARLHPPGMTLASRLDCLQWLREEGYQVGCGFMVGSPGQTVDNLVDDLLLIREFQPEMVGIGPFIPARGTPFADHPAGDVGLTLFLLSLVRLILPKVLLPATTALGTALPDGREQGILAGANVVMPNLSPPDARDKYMLYDNKLRSHAEAAENLDDLRHRLESIGRTISVGRGDFGDSG
ncbi:MAG: [FeFe] hydrogenase H-cluster radical SAM maturase HydE [Planctomycetaceae bacterium]|nr:[FeFe] hydrogenase H-cluster radical SAM maturase HydE [Planctomycetaceae bacterium]